MPGVREIIRSGTFEIVTLRPAESVIVFEAGVAETSGFADVAGDELQPVITAITIIERTKWKIEPVVLKRMLLL